MSSRAETRWLASLRGFASGGALVARGGEDAEEDEENDGSGGSDVNRVHPGLTGIGTCQQTVEGDEEEGGEAHIVDAAPNAIGYAAAQPGADQHDGERVERDDAEIGGEWTVGLREGKDEVGEAERDEWVEDEGAEMEQDEGASQQGKKLVYVIERPAGADREVTGETAQDAERDGNSEQQVGGDGSGARDVPERRAGRSDTGCCSCGGGQHAHHSVCEKGAHSAANPLPGPPCEGRKNGTGRQDTGGVS